MTPHLLDDRDGRIAEAMPLGSPETTAVSRRREEVSQPQARPTVCQVLHTLQVGGAEVLAARLARRLRDSYRFLFVCLDALGTLGEKLRGEGFSVEVLDRRAGLDWRSCCDWPNCSAGSVSSYCTLTNTPHSFTP